MPLGRPIGPTPLTSAPVIGLLLILLHRGGAAEATTWRLSCSRLPTWLLQVYLHYNLHTQRHALSVQIAMPSSEQAAARKVAHVTLGPAASARAHALDSCRASLWLWRLGDTRLDRPSSAEGRLGHGWAAQTRWDPLCMLSTIMSELRYSRSRNEPATRHLAYKFV